MRRIIIIKAKKGPSILKRHEVKRAPHETNNQALFPWDARFHSPNRAIKEYTPVRRLLWM